MLQRVHDASSVDDERRSRTLSAQSDSGPELPVRFTSNSIASSACAAATTSWSRAHARLLRVQASLCRPRMLARVQEISGRPRRGAFQPTHPDQLPADGRQAAELHRLGAAGCTPTTRSGCPAQHLIVGRSHEVAAQRYGHGATAGDLCPNDATSGVAAALELCRHAGWYAGRGAC